MGAQAHTVAHRPPIQTHYDEVSQLTGLKRGCRGDDLRRYLSKTGLKLDFVEVDIRIDKTIFEKFKYDIPVLMEDDKVVLKHRFSKAQLEKYLEKNMS
ncbi:unnamed protein product [Bursaphelenchus okinawaensis]|uniref:Glutaredoxin-like protein n=1 Tax=Bursaphelenchus okinawaensis TaxID=465554 RepID=A0A811LMI3_9BILA|nr:unnamed protein product [Bursaphelenchus okinawaensis]CAG9125285.1 unnamed protein product [Bursaphelenchus okinawaensis]